MDASVGSGRECAGCETDWGFSGFGVVGGVVWWICVGELCYAEEFAEESLTELSESQRIETFSRRVFRIILLTDFTSNLKSVSRWPVRIPSKRYSGFVDNGFEPDLSFRC